jgi:general secretion pathway protein H
MLIVIVIMGITFGFALMAFGDFGESRRLQFAAEQLVNTLKLAQQQAILTNSTLGLYIDNNHFQILQFKNGSHWESLSNNTLFKSRSFPKNTFIQMKTNQKSSKKNPALIINPSGTTTPFTLYFGTDQEKTKLSLTGSHNGFLRINK